LNEGFSFEFEGFEVLDVTIQQPGILPYKSITLLLLSSLLAKFLIRVPKFIPAPVELDQRRKI
jgi:hypothetical protein